MANLCMGMVQANKAQSKRDVAYYQAAISAWEATGTRADTNYLRAYILLAGNWRSLAQYDSASQTLQKAHLIAEACKNADMEGIVWEYMTEKAHWYAEMSQYSEATEWYEQAAVWQERLHGEKSPQLAIALIAQAQYLSNSLSEHYQAAELLERAERILGKVEAQFPKEYANSLTLLAGLYSFSVPNYEAVEPTLKRALAVVDKHLGATHRLKADILKTIASYLQLNTARFMEANDLIQQARSINTQHLGENNIYEIGLLQDLAGWYGNSYYGYFDTAVVIRSRALELCNSIWGNQHPGTAMLTMAVADDYENAGNQIAADSLIQQAEQVYLQCYGQRHKSRLEILDQYIYSSLYNKAHKADSLIKASLALRADLWGRTSPAYWEGVIFAQGIYNFSKYATADSLYQILIPYLASHEKAKGINYLQAKYFNRAYYFKYVGQLDSAVLSSEYYMEEIAHLVGQENFRYLSALQQQILILDDPKADIGKRQELNERFGTLIQKIFGTNSMGYIQYLEYQIEYLAATRIPAEIIPIKKKIIDLKKGMGNSENTILNLTDLALECILNGLYTTADSLLQEAIVITVSNYGKTSVYYQHVCLILVQRYVDIGDFGQAKHYLKEAQHALAITGNSLSLEVLYEFFTGNYEEAIGNYLGALKSLERREKLMRLQGEDPLLNPFLLNQYYVAFLNLGRYKEAESYINAALSTSRAAGETNLTISLLNNLGVLQGNQGDYEAARENIKTAMHESLTVYGTEHSKTASMYNNYGLLLFETGNTQAAIDTITLALRILEQAQARGNAADIALYTQNLAVCYDDLGNYLKADSLYNKALNIARKSMGKNHPKFRYYEKNYASMLMDVGNWSAADSIFSSQLDYWEQHPYRNLEYIAYANFFEQTGQYERGFSYAQRAEDALDETMQRSLSMSHILSAQAHCLHGMGHIDKALKRIDAILDLLRELVGDKHPAYASHLSHAGKLLIQLQRHEEAEDYLQEALAIREGIYGVKSRELAWTLTPLAELYASQNRLEEAQTAIAQSLAIQENYGDEHKAAYFEALLQYARIAYQQGQVALGDTLAARVQHFYTQRAKAALGYMSYGQQTALLENASQQHVFPTMQALFPTAHLSGLCYNNALLAKSSALDGGRNLKEQYLQSRDAANSRLYGQYADLQQQIASIYRQPTEYRYGLDSLERSAEALQKQLIQQSPEYQQYLADVSTDWPRIQSALAANEAAVEYIRYREDLGEQEGGYHYAALVLRPGMAAPAWVYLCQEEDLSYWLGDERNAIKARDYANAMTRGSFGNADEDRKTPYELSWQPLDALLAGVNKVFVSPVGLLHRVAFAALPTEKGSSNRLMDRYELALLRSTRHVITDTPALPKGAPATALLIGDVDYGSTAPNQPLAQRGHHWKRLTHGNSEYTAIRSTLQTRNVNISAFTQATATKAAFVDALKTGNRPPDLIHTIVHGYYGTSATPGDTTLLDPNPMRRSGLVMAGANTLPNQQDAIVLAQDISHLDLRGTRLVVLSACETGLGTAAGSEGVFGLQRAFLEAGAAHVIVSLWSVDDASTSSFMALFYQNWLGGQRSIPEAFRQTQEAMRWKIDGSGNKREEDAYLWAGFILVE